MSDTLSAAAAALGIPEALVQRSAEARASETGMSVEEILAAWAGGGTIESAPAASLEPEDEVAADETGVPPAVDPQGESGDDTGTAPAAAAVAAASSESPAATSHAAVPAEVGPAEAAYLPEVITVPTAGIRERTNFRIPAWLVAVLVIIPAFALFTLGAAATGSCGDATELGTNVVTGQIVNCDGSEFTGSGVAGGGGDFIGAGEAIYNGSGVSGVNCSGCHGASGGGGVGPALTGVLTTFGSCADHEEWVKLGTSGFQADGRATYGDTNKPVGGGGQMPSHASLTDEQLASVVSFERVRFGGADVDATLVDCGLVEAEGGDDDSTTDGDGSVPPGEDDGTTESTIAGDTTATTVAEAAAS